MSELIHALSLVVCNSGNNPTFKTSSTIDVTFASPGLADRISEWGVLDVESLSDHHYVQFIIRTDPSSSTVPPKTKWMFSYNKLDEVFSSEQLPGISDSIGAEDSAVLLTTMIHEACMTKSAATHRRKSVYWWSPEINDLRKIANHARRVFQRRRKRMGALAVSAEERAAKDAKLEVIKAIKAAKDRAWKALCDQVESDPWGTPYKLVMGKLKRHEPIPGLDSPDTVGRLVNVLFPAHPPRAPSHWPRISEPDLAGASIISKEVQLVAMRIKNNIAHGPDGIPNEALKLLAARDLS